MSVEQYWLFVFFTVLVVVSPGPAVFHTINNGLNYGVRASSFGVLGNVVAMLILVALSIAGIGALIVSSESIFMVLKFVGALYLCYLGVKLWFRCSSVSGRLHIEPLKSSKIKMFRESFFVTASNPKALALVTALLPQFIRVGEEFSSQFLLMGLTVAAIQFSVLMFYAWAASKMRVFLEVDRTRGLLNKVTGSVLMVFGFSLAVFN